MGKFLLAGLIVSGLILAGAAVHSSQSAEHHYRALELRLAEVPDVRVLESSYQRGLSESVAETSFELRGGLGDSFRRGIERAGREDVRGRVGFRTRHEIRHGLAPLWSWLRDGAEGSPVVARVTTSIELDQEAQSELLAVVGRLPAVRVETTVRSSGIGESEIHAAAARLRAKLDDPQTASGSSGEFRGLHGAVVFQPENGALAGQLTSPGFLLEGPENTISFEGLELQFDTQLDASGVRVGKVEPSVARLRVGPTRPAETAPPASAAETAEAADTASVVAAAEDADPGADATAAALRTDWLELTELRAAQQLRLTGGKLEAVYALALQGLVVNGERHGPAELDIAIRDVDATAVKESGSGPAGLLRAGRPMVDLSRFELATGHGLVRATGHLRLTGGWPDGSAANPLLALLGLDAALELEGPSTLLESVWPADAPALVELEESGHLAREGETARVRLEFEGGALTANGLPIDPGLFSASLGELAEARVQGRRP